MKNLAIIGASYLQLPLIRKAKDMGYTTHVFAWAANDVGEKEADYFYPISIVEKDEILNKCREIGIDGICSIASDLAIITVNYVAQHMGLTSNSLACTEKSTNKHLMRECFLKNGDPSPKSFLVTDVTDLNLNELLLPLIVKPTDRSGSRGITKIESFDELKAAIEAAKAESFEKKALVEEFATGQEYSVECVSWKGEHHFLTMTKKYTTGAPHFIETGHLEPAGVKEPLLSKVKEIVFHALDSLGIEYGASHSELKIDESGRIRLIEIGGRMGGDFIGSDLVKQSTGIDFVKAVIDVSLGKEPDLCIGEHKKYAGVRFIFNQNDLQALEKALREDNDKVIAYDADYENIGDLITDSSNRHGFFILSADEKDIIKKYFS